jgi:ubiquinone/menaquinone biosynthesis C-methylase UbiE
MSRSASVYADFLLPHLTAESLVVDIGCGDGELTVDLAVSVRRIVGVDTDEGALAHARARAERAGVSNATFENGDAYALAIPAGTADAVFAHSVVEALERPVQAVTEMHRVLRPGGVVALASVEYGGLILAGPHVDLLRRFYAIREQLWLLDGADPYRGRRLRGLVTESGFVDVVASTTSISYGTPELVSSFGNGRAEDCVDNWYVSEALRARLASQAELDEMREAWLTWADSPDSYASFAWCRAVGRKR